MTLIWHRLSVQLQLHRIGIIGTVLSLHSFTSVHLCIPPRHED